MPDVDRRAEALFVGEVNPYGVHGYRPEYALYPYPERSAGSRLCRFILGLPPAEYLSRFDRTNLCFGHWSMPAARKAATTIKHMMETGEAPGHRGVAVLLGAKVSAAFDLEFKPFTKQEMMMGGWRVVILPHPSGRCRLWSEPGAVVRARQVLEAVGIAGLCKE